MTHSIILMQTTQLTWSSNLVHKGDHIIGVYPNKKIELEEAFEFLKDGLQKNETVMLITEAFSKTEIRDKMNTILKVNVDKLEAEGEIIIKTTKQWFFPDGSFAVNKIKDQWSVLVDESNRKEKSGFRVFEDTSSFFKRGFVKELIHYESTLGQRFNFPITAICGYLYEEIDTLNLKQFRKLQEHHNLVWF
jgi:hypothetical protein